MTVTLITGANEGLGHTTAAADGLRHRARGIEPPSQHLPFQELGGGGDGRSLKRSVLPRLIPYEQIARRHRRSQSKGTGMKIVVIGLTGLIGSKLVATITQVSHA